MLLDRREKTKKNGSAPGRAFDDDDDDDDDDAFVLCPKKLDFYFLRFFLCSLFSPSSITLSRRKEDTIPKGLSTDTKRTLCMRLGNDEHER